MNTPHELTSVDIFDKPLLVHSFHELTSGETLSHFGNHDHVFPSRSFDASLPDNCSVGVALIEGDFDPHREQGTPHDCVLLSNDGTYEYGITC